MKTFPSLIDSVSSFSRAVLLCAAAVSGVIFPSFADGLPDGYTRLSYIKANGNCYVKTGVTPASTDRVEMEFRPGVVVNDTQALWCSRNLASGTNGQFTAHLLNSAKVRIDRGNTSSGQVTSSATLLACTNYYVVADYSTLEAVITNVAANTQAASLTLASGSYTPGSELCLFAAHSTDVGTGLGNYASYALYSFKLKDSSGNLRLDLVPAERDSDGTRGLYDLARSTFLTNCQSGCFTKANQTITPSDPEWGKTLTVSDGITIDAGSGATWQGAITVYEGGSLTTRGNLQVAGTTTLNAGGSVDVETGTQLITFAQDIMGALTVRAGATLKFHANERFHDKSTTAVFHLYGTLDVQTYRQRVDKGTYFFHDGARVVGAGDGYGGLYAYRDSRIVFDGDVEIEPPVTVYNGYTFTVACCENASVKFNGGVKAYSTNQQSGAIVQEAATADEGNASGTCANASLEFGPCAVDSLYDFTGSFTFLSPAKIALGHAESAFTVSSAASSLEIVANAADALAGHTVVQTLPTISAHAASGTYPSVRLTGDGTVALPADMSAYPMEFAGPSLVVADATPTALSSGTTFTSNTTVLVEGLAADTAATLFTNAGSIDVTKLSAAAAYKGTALGAGASVTLDGTSAVVASAPVTDAYAWIAPYLKAKALLWLDASDAANFEFKDNTFGLVTTWKDLSAYGRDATAYTITSHDAAWGSLSVTNGVYAYCMGDCDSGIDLQYTRMTTIRTVFWAMSIRQSQAAFFLGDTGYQFHRGSNGAYCYNHKSAIWKNGSIYCDGVKVANNTSDLVPTDRHVFTAVTAANCCSCYLSADRPDSVVGRNGGREISELICLNEALADADRQAIEAYLMAKWMGTSPTAAGTDGTYDVSGDMEVDGFLGGSQNLVFADGASVTVSNPSTTNAFLSTTGAVTIPSGSTLAVSVDASNLAPGTYTVIQAASGITDISQFAASATTVNGVTATFSIVDGALVMTLALDSSSSATLQTWRPSNASDIGWNYTSANWLYDGGSTGGFLAYVPAVIDGAETATGDISVTGTVAAASITLTGANDYTFAGSGTLNGNETVSFGGTGTITLEGVNFADQTIAISNGQKVVLGYSAGEKSLGNDSGSSGGKVHIGNGGQLNINYTGVASNDSDPRAEITQLKTFVIEGDGADGRGAIVNDALDGRTTHTYYNAATRRIELAGDASVGGTDRFDVRLRSGTAATATAGLYGEGKTLTVRNSAFFCVRSLPIEVGAVVVPSGGKFLLATTAAMIDIPGGITLDGGHAQLFGAVTYPAAMPIFVTANGGTLEASGGAITVNGDVNVASGAALALIGDKDVTYAGAFNANGATVTHSNSATTYFTGTSSGNFDITQTAGTIQLQNSVGGTVTVTKSAGNQYFGNGFTGGVATVVQTSGGGGGFYVNNSTAPVFDTLTFNATGGTLYGWTYNTDAEADVSGTVDFGSNAAVNFYVLGSANAKGIAIKAIGKTKQFGAGYSSARPGTLRLKSGTDLTVSDLCAGCVSKPSRGHVIVDSGAKVTCNRFINAYYASLPAEVATHRTDIYGQVTATGDGYVSMDAPRGEVYIHEGGVLTTPTLYSQRGGPFAYGTGCDIGNGRQWLLLDGGRLETGSLSGKSIPGATKFDLYDGTVANTKTYGTTQGLAVFFGHDAVGGEVEFNLKDGTYVNLNTALSGASAVTLTGGGYVGGTRSAVGGVYQGALLGKFTVATTATTTNDLRNASAFLGGLAVADGAHASVGKYSEEHYPFALTLTSSGAYHHGMFETNDFSYPYVAGDAWTYAHKYCASGTKPYSNYAEWGLRCKFYVPAEKAGTWTFSGTYDDYLRLNIDGTNICNILYSAPTAHTFTLAEGWHRFTVATHDQTGGIGPSKNNWTDGKAFGFIVGESTSTDGNDYTAFKPGADLGDDLTLQVQPLVNACVWSYSTNKPANATYQALADSGTNWQHIKCLESVEYMHKTGSSTTDTLGYFLNKLNKFEGWFKVEDGKEGEWTFKMAYDDFHRFKVDGTVLITRASSSETATGTVTLTAGWHRWEAVVGDAGGNWGPRTYNSGYAVSYILPGETTNRRFDETNLKLAATLGDIAALEPSGIYNDLEVGAGATLTSAGTMAMPIYGTLKGTGTLAGDFAFAGSNNCWSVTNAVATSATLPAATFSDATADTFAGLKSISVTFNGKPTRSKYYLTGTINGLTAPDATVTVRDGTTDYSENFTLSVKDGRLALQNAGAIGTILIVR